VLLLGLAGAALLIDEANRLRQRVNARLGRIGPGAPASVAAPSVRLAVKQASAMERVAALLGCDFTRRHDYPVPWWLVPIVAAVAGRIAAFLAAGILGAASWAVMPIVWVILCRGVYRGWNAKRRDLMLEQFPDALGMIVRTVRVGIPVLEGMRLVGRESPDPTGAEFRHVIEEIAIGTPLDLALRLSAERTGMPEYRFFATAIALQMQTGGGLSEALDTLAEVVRKRLEIKVRGFALTSEARTSALVLGVMPFLIALMMMFSSPGYLDVLYTTPTGTKMLGFGALSLCIGIAVMRMLIRKTLA